MLVGSAERIARGPGVAQAATAAACGRWASSPPPAGTPSTTTSTRLADDHARARRLAEAVADVRPELVDVDAVETNIVVLDLAGRGQSAAADVAAAAREHGVLLSVLGPRTLRLVTHLDVDDEACEHAARRPGEGAGLTAPAVPGEADPRRWEDEAGERSRGGIRTGSCRRGNGRPTASACCTTARCRGSARRRGGSRSTAPPPTAASTTSMPATLACLPRPRPRRPALRHPVDRDGQHLGGVPTRALLDLVPPAPEVTHVMAWAEYGYSATHADRGLRLARALLATHHNGEPLTPRARVPAAAGRAAPLRLEGPEMAARASSTSPSSSAGFWEERGYHAVGDPWREERYSYQE